MADDDRGADVLTLPTINLSPPGPAPDDDDVPTLPEPPSTAPPPDFTLPFHLPEDEEDDSEYDPDDVADEMVTEAVSGTGTPARATASMAMVTMAAIAVAALRGTWSVAAYLKARREHHDAVADKAREAADKQKVANAAKAAKGRVPSGPEFGRGAAKGGGRGGSSGGGSGRGAFGQQKPSGKGGRSPGSSGSAGAGGRGAGPKGMKGPGSRNDSGGPGRRGTKGSGSGSGKGPAGSGSGKGSGGSASKKPGTIGQLALARQKRKADEAKAQRQAAADERKADLADRASARRQAEKKADDRRKRKAERRKAKQEREKAGGDDTSTKGPKSPKGDKSGKGKGDSDKVDPKKKPKADDGPTADPKGDKSSKGKDKSGKDKDDTEKTDSKKKPRKKRRSWRWKRGGGKSGPWKYRRRKRGKQGSTDSGDMPGSDGEWLKPPPGWDVGYSVTVDREPAPRRPRGGIGTGQKGLPAGKSGEVTPTRTTPKEGPIVMGPAAAVGDVGDTQFVDADLTVYDLIESDEEMSEEILQGVEHMRVVASKCEGLKSGLEDLYATCLRKKVPGVLVKWTIRLMERAGSVQDKAEALAQSLPRSSEAILSARDVAVEADKRRADAVKDAGHVAPAEREYHDRSGV